MPRLAPVPEVRPEDLPVLRNWARSTSVRAGLAQRAKIVLAASDGVGTAEIARRVGCSRPTVILWRGRYAKAGLQGLADEPRSGRPRVIGQDVREQILAATLAGPPPESGVTHWSARRLGKHVGVSHMTVVRVWADHCLAPHRTETFKYSTDPEL